MTDQGSREAAALYEAAVDKSRESIMGSVIPDTRVILRTPEKQRTQNARPSQAARLKRVFQDMTREQLVQGIVLSEILGKPVSLRKGHRR